jgi:hypothetical protein
MGRPPATPTDLARCLADAFEDASLPYAIGGAIALGFYVPPRATLDVDVNVFMSPRDDFAATLQVLVALGFTTPEPTGQLQTQAGDERLVSLGEIERDVQG